MLRALRLAGLVAAFVLTACQAGSPQRHPEPIPEAQRNARVRQRFGEWCRFERACGDLWGIDCDAAVDGPYYYVDADSMDVVSLCGGYCMGGHCKDCPPKAWTCPTY